MMSINLIGFETVIKRGRRNSSAPHSLSVSTYVRKAKKEDEYPVFKSVFYIGTELAKKADMNTNSLVDIRYNRHIGMGVVMLCENGRKLISTLKHNVFRVVILQPDSLCHINKITKIEIVKIEPGKIFFTWPN